MNKELVLREYLAVERTKLVNESTFLAYVRTGLYFFVAGSTLGQLMETTIWKISGPSLIAIGFVIITAGAIRFVKVKKAIRLSQKNIGSASDAFVKEVRGNLIE